MALYMRRGAPSLAPLAPQAQKLQQRDADTSSTDWTADDATVPGGNAHLWEESWDDDDDNEEFSKQLKEELKKVEAGKA